MPDSYSNPRGPTRPDYYDGAGLDYGKKEQRFAWSFKEALENANLNISTSSSLSEVLFNGSLNPSASTPSISVESKSNLRVFVQIVDNTQSEIALELSFDGIEWFPHCLSPLIFISQGKYTFTIDNLSSLFFRVTYLSGGSPILLGVVGS
jgi:hypothetical protein